MNSLHVTMAVSIRIPLFAFDLTYDLDKGRHLVLAVQALEMQMVSRPHDMRILFDLNELSMQDSFRSKDQRDLIRTPLGSKNLIHVSYTTISSSLSPYYCSHATEVIIDFRQLALNFDVNTMLHLRPFMVAIRGKPSLETFPVSTNPPNPASMTPVPKSIPTPDPTSLDDSESIKGMHIFFTVNNISLELLRVASGEVENAELQNAFSLQIVDLRADVDMMDLITAGLKYICV